MANVADSNQRPAHDLVVVSDLHLGEGVLKSEPRYSPTEDFFCDRQFANFLDYLEEKYSVDPSGLVLVLNGDSFDFLTVVRVPSVEGARRRSFSVSTAEESFGLNPTAEKSVYKLDVIATGHPVFFKALARFVAAGFRVVIIRGNHDLELHFPEVQHRLLEHLVQAEPHLTLEAATERVSFHEWFYLEPERVYIEHGNQYDSANSTRYPLRPILPERKGRQSAREKEVLDYPLGSIFVRFFYNRVRRIDPYTPRLLSFEQYLDFLRRYNLFDVWRIYKDYYPHFVAALGPATTTGSSRSSEEEDARQERDFREIEERDEHGHLYRRLNELKIYPAAASKPAVVKEMIAPMVRRGLWLSVFAFIGVFMWFVIFQLIDEIPWLPAEVFVLSLFAVVTFGFLFWTWIHLQRKLRQRSKESAVEIFVERSEKIVEMTNVPLVLMGHTHMVDYRKIRRGRATYANSGTWTSVENPWNRIARDARRMTFLLVKGHSVELMRWNDDAGRTATVPLFYLEEERMPDILPHEPALEIRPGRRSSWAPGPGGADDDLTGG